MLLKMLHFSELDFCFVFFSLSLWIRLGLESGISGQKESRAFQCAILEIISCRWFLAAHIHYHIAMRNIRKIHFAMLVTLLSFVGRWNA